MTQVTIDDHEADEAEIETLARLCPQAFKPGRPLKHFTWHYAWTLAKESPCMI